MPRNGKEIQSCFFKELRKRCNLTQLELAEYLGVTPATVSRWETEKHVPKLTFKQFKTILLLLQVVGLKITDLPE